MKRTMIVVCIAVASLALAVGAEEGTKPQTLSSVIAKGAKPVSVLVATAQLAPFGEVTRKVRSLGRLIGSRDMTELLILQNQQQLVDTYGPLRTDAPVTWLAYLQVQPLAYYVKNLGKISVEDMYEYVLVYPMAEGPASLLTKHAGATKDADGTVHIPQGDENPTDVYVKYTADNRYCAFASSPAMAAKALKDFETLSARRKTEKKSQLVRVEIVERGVAALSAICSDLMEEQRKTLAEAGTNDVSWLWASLHGQNQKKVKTLLETISSVTFTLDMDASGLVLDVLVRPKPGRKTPYASDFVLPAGTLDNVPAAAPVFYFIGDRFSAQCSDEATFRADMAAMGDGMEALISQMAEKTDDTKYRLFLKDVGTAFSQMFKTFPFPDATDWTGLWLSLDNAGHPYFEGMRQAAKTAETRECSERFNESVIAAVEKQWPGKGLLVKGPDGVIADFAALVDLCGAEAGVKPGDREAKELANAKKKISRVFGSCKLVSATSYDGNTTRTHVSAFGQKPPAATQPTGEARMAAILPEIEAKRPVAVFGLELYSLVRNGVLPVMAKVSKKKQAKWYSAIMAAMPPPKPNSAIACASWTDANGSVRSLLRITTGELKNFGSAFKAFTAATLVGADND